MSQARTKTQHYADAIVALAQAEDALDTVEDELLTVARAVEGDAQLRERLTGSSMPVGRQLELIDSDALIAAHASTRTALACVIAGGQLAELRSIATAVVEQAAADRDRELAEVTVAVPIDEERRRGLRRALEEATGKQLELKVFVDPDVVGGVRARVGDTVIDGSVSQRLADVRTRFAT